MKLNTWAKVCTISSVIRRVWQHINACFCYLFIGVVHADLKLFLETNLPSGGKKKAVFGVADGKIGAALQEELGLSIQTGGVVVEVLRGLWNECEMSVTDLLL